MVPIYEQGSGKGIGHSVESFLAEFQKIAIEHIETGRAKSIAFVFYDFNNRDFKKILKDQGVFAELDRLSGKELSVFYMHSGSDAVLRTFNSTLLTTLGVEDQVRTPCLVFCKVTPEGFTDASTANLNSANLIHGFHELYGVIESYIKGEKIDPDSKYIRWTRTSSKFISLEAVKALIRELLRGGMF
jgi:hypothetical protein